MAILPQGRVKGVGAIGVIKDLSTHELPINAWTDSQNMRFLDGYAMQFFGEGEVYSGVTEAPQHVLPVNLVGQRYWIYTTAGKTFATTITGGVAVHTDITHLTPRVGVVNAWTSTTLSGVPVLNAGDKASIPMYWGLDLTQKCMDLPNWPANTYCRSIRAYKNSLIALGITKGSQEFPYMVKWSTPADPGSLPISWDPSDATQDAGELDLAEGSDPIIDGLQLRDYFMVYKESSIWRMSFIGGTFVYSFAKELGTSGALNRNCICEIDGYHFVLTGSDVIYHDGQSAVSILDKRTRRFLFQNIDVEGAKQCFVFKNPFFNEVFVCYPGVGSASCDRAMVWNYVDKTVSFRDMPNVNHAAYGAVDNGLAGTWNADSAPWDSDLTLWDGPDFVPSTTRTILASQNVKLYMMDSSASFDGVMPESYLERRGLSFDQPERRKLVLGIRPRIMGSNGTTVLVYVGSSDDPYADPEYADPVEFIIGESVSVDVFVEGRYIAIKFANGNAYQFRLDSYDFDLTDAGEW